MNRTLAPSNAVFEAVVKVRPTGADPDDEVRVARDAVRGERPGRADRAERERVVVRQRALAGLGLGDRDPAAIDERAQRVGRAAVDDPAARDDERPARGVDELDRPTERGGVRRAPLDVPHALREELVRDVECLGLHVLRQRQRDRSGLGLVGENAHRVQRGGDDLLGPRDAVPVLRHGLQRVVHGHVAARWDLELLQHRIRPARREHVARK